MKKLILASVALLGTTALVSAEAPAAPVAAASAPAAKSAAPATAAVAKPAPAPQGVVVAAPHAPVSVAAPSAAPKKKSRHHGHGGKHQADNAVTHALNADKGVYVIKAEPAKADAHPCCQEKKADVVAPAVGAPTAAVTH
jgi:hypothetical protein